MAQKRGLSAGFLRLQRLVRQSSFATANLRSEKPIHFSVQLDPLVANDVAMEPARLRDVGCEGGARARRPHNAEFESIPFNAW